MKYAYHFVADKLRDGRPVPPDGVWLKHEGEIAICKTGLHASWRVADALQFAPGPTLCLVQVRYINTEESDKLVCRWRKIVARIDATELLRADARASALSVLKNWKGEVPQVVMDWLTTGDEKYRSAAGSAAWSAARSMAGNAARSAAWSAARSAAWSATGSAARSTAESAAWSTAESAAWSAARSAARSRLQKSVQKAFAALGYNT